MDKVKELRNTRVSGRIKGSLNSKVEKFMQKKKWSMSDCIEEGLVRLVSGK